MCPEWKGLCFAKSKEADKTLREHPGCIGALKCSSAREKENVEPGVPHVQMHKGVQDRGGPVWRQVGVKK